MKYSMMTSILLLTACLPSLGQIDNKTNILGTRKLLDKQQILQLGGHTGNGGDLGCDAKIQAISANIQNWIENNGPTVGQLKLSSSFNETSRKPYTVQEYSSALLSLLRLPLNVSCVRSINATTDPVHVGGSVKICATSVDASEVRMICDRDLFSRLSPDMQIQQVHHEMATNIPGLEPDKGPLSSYKISSQLASYTRQLTETKLVVTPPAGTQPAARVCEYSYAKDVQYNDVKKIEILTAANAITFHIFIPAQETKFRAFDLHKSLAGLLPELSLFVKPDHEYKVSIEMATAPDNANRYCDGRFYANEMIGSCQGSRYTHISKFVVSDLSAATQLAIDPANISGAILSASQVTDDNGAGPTAIYKFSGQLTANSSTSFHLSAPGNASGVGYDSGASLEFQDDDCSVRR